METLKSVFILSVLLLCYSDASRSKEVYKVNIDERGTRFKETVEINGKKNTVVYKVPKHNDVAQSEMLFDYKTGYFATRIPELKECYIQRIPKGQPSPGRVRKYLQQYRVFKRSRSSTIPVKTMAATVIKERKIDPGEFSSSLSAFCGNFVAYKGRQVNQRKYPQMKRNEINGKVVGKNVRSFSVPINWRPRHVEPQSIDVHEKYKDGWKKVTLNTCKKLKAYQSVLKKGGCDGNPDDWEYICGAKTRTCMYSVKCKLTSTGNGIERQIRCEEIHFFTGWTCCDVKCSD